MVQFIGALKLIQISERRVVGGYAGASRLQAWIASLDDVKNLEILHVVLKPISDLISDEDPDPKMRESKRWLRRALEIKESVWWL